MATPTLDRFLSEISRLIGTKDSAQLASFLIIEPPYAESYNTIIKELRQTHPKGRSDDSALEGKCQAKLNAIREGSDGAGGYSSSWTAFAKFIVVYLCFLRDVDVGNLLETYNLLSELLQKANSALTHQSFGVLILPTVVNYSRMLSRLAIGLDKQPQLIAHVVSKSASSGDDGGPRETLPERAANILRQAFVTCLNDRTGSSATGLSRDGTPEGKKRGIYTIANLCLKILFSCRKTRGAAQIFENIYNQSPPLSAYPKSERVTYLYYLGRFAWTNSHFYRAQKALQAAYDECHPQCISQRRLILIFLIASNLVCGRFPSQQVLSRPEARGLRERFEPLCRYVRQGNIVAFRRHLDYDSEHYSWFSYYRVDLQLRNRCEVYVWRSLVRKTYLLNGDPGNPEARKAPTIDLNDVLALFLWQERNYLVPPGQMTPKVYNDPDFIGMTDLDDSGEEALDLPTKMSIFSKMSSLVSQELLNGYLSYSKQKFAIQGARTKGALAAGFPNIWKKIENASDEEVPGWKKEDTKAVGFGAAKPQFGGGMVVNLSGARPVGSGFP